MWHFLVVYDRLQGRIVRRHGFRSSDEALAARFTAEQEFLGQPDIEVVVLTGKSYDALKHTHARYFKGVQEMAEAALRSAVACGS